MSTYKTPGVLPRFNAALNEMKGDGSEADLAEMLGCTQRTLQKWRRGELPKAVLAIVERPAVVIALSSDRTASANNTKKTSDTLHAAS